MDNQEAFLKVREHLLTQKTTATLGHSCAYRGENGTKCAIGCLIPDEEYQAAFESGMLVYDIYDDVPALKGLDADMLADLQYCHDQVSHFGWEQWLNDYGRAHGYLDPSPST